MQKDDLITARFRVQLPSVLQHASPALAAFHATKARLLLHPAPEADVLRPTHCVRCGAYLLDGTGTVRAARRPVRGQTRGAKPYVRVLRRSCGSCGGEEDVPLEQAEAVARQACANAGAAKASVQPALPATQRATPDTPATVQSRPSSLAPSRQPSQTPSTAPSRQHSQTPVATPPVPSRTATPAVGPAQNAPDARAKSRPKKKTGLQDMLARNRERQEQEKKAAGGGLAAFLQDL